MRRGGGSFAFGALAVLVVACSYAQDFEPLAASADAGAPGAESPSVPVPPLADGGCASQTDPESCGVCGHSCLGGECVAGECRAVVLASGLGDSGGVNGGSTDGGHATGPSVVAVDASHVYWVKAGGTLQRVPVAGGAVETIASVPLPVPAGRLHVTDDAVFAHAWAGDLVRVAKRGFAVTHVMPAGSKVIEFALQGADLFLVLPLQNRRALHRCPLATCGTSLPAPLYVPDARFAIDGLAVSGDLAFVSLLAMDGSKEAGLQKIDARTGKPLYLIGRDAARYSGPIADATNVYAAEPRALLSAPISPNPDASVTADKVLASGEDVRVGAVAGQDEGFLYWHEPWGPRRVVRCAKKGCITPEVLWVSAAGKVPTDWWGKPGAADGVVSLAVDERALYFATGDGQILKLAKRPRERNAPAPF